MNDASGSPADETHRFRVLGCGHVESTGADTSVPQLIRDLPDRLREPSLELIHRDVIDPGRASLGRHLLERRQQIPFREDLVKQPKPLASFHSLFESRQHAHGPGRRFDPSPAREGLSGLLSQRHYRRFVFRSAWSCRIHLPGALRSPGVTRLRRYYGSSDSCPMAAGSSGTRLVHDRSLCFMCMAFRPFRLQPPPRPSHRFDTLPLSVGGIRLAPVWASPLASRLAARAGRIEFTCVADWPFTSGCFPPRLAATQFPSVTGRRAST